MTNPAATTPTAEPTLRDMIRAAVNATRNAAHTARHGDDPRLTEALNDAVAAILTARDLFIEGELNPSAQEEEPMTNPAADLSDEAQEVIVNLAVENAYLHIRNDSRDNYNMFRVEPGGHYRHPNGPTEGIWTVANVWLGAVHDGIIAELKRHDLITCTRESADGRLALRYEATIAGAEARAALIY